MPNSLAHLCFGKCGVERRVAPEDRVDHDETEIAP
jgi:hypothetical protein